MQNHFTSLHKICWNLVSKDMKRRMFYHVLNMVNVNIESMCD